MGSDSNERFPVPIRPATAVDIEALRRLFREYASTLAIDLCFQNFEQELSSLPGKYAPPHGGLWLAGAGPDAAGCIALRPMEPGICEVKRLYVRPSFRRSGIGRELVRVALTEATRIGYNRVRLDTLREMKAAVALYQGMGFRETAPYRDGEPQGICYFERRLDR
jgi:putative acetyltransferase